MSEIHTSVVEPSHRYTRMNSPWILDHSASIYGRLVHYLSGGGLATFGRTVRQERVRRRHRRFYVWVGALALVWLVFYVA